MEIKSTQSNNIAILELNGRYDAYTMHIVEDWLTKTKKDVVIDLSQVNFIDNAALKSLAKNTEKKQEQKGSIRLCNLSQPVQIIMELTNYNQKLEIYESKVQAAEKTISVLVV